MGNTVNLNSPEMLQLEQDIAEAIRRIPGEVSSVIEKAAVNVKNDWQDGWSGLRSAPSLAAAVSYDLTDPLTAEVGPDKGSRQGALGNLLEYGSRNNAPIPAGMHALDREEPRLVHALIDVAVGLIPPR